MIKYISGDILKSGAEALVNSVNCVGVMGRGIALQFKNAYPQNFKFYKRACDRGEVQPGKMLVYETGYLSNPKYIINFPTKRHWRGKSRLEDIDAGLAALVEEIARRSIQSIAIPPLGSGLGGLQWEEVRPRIAAALATIPDLDVIVFEPTESGEVRRTTQSPEVPSMTSPRAALVVLIDRYLHALLDPYVTLLEVHKLMYFMQEAGEPLKLKYVPHHYGPYADNLRHLLRTVEGYMVAGYADGGDLPHKQIELVPGAIEDANRFLSSEQETFAHVNRVTDLVDGFETPFGLELLSTVHWVATRNAVTSAQDVVELVYAWGQRKERFSPEQIGIALDTLSEQGWLTGASIDLRLLQGAD